MNTRERLLAVLNHQPLDRIPWVARLELWYNARLKTNTMPPQWAGYSLRQVEKALGLGTSARDGRIYQISYDGVDVVSRTEGSQTITEYFSPAGNLRQVIVSSQELLRQGITGLTREHLLKTPQDYRIFEWIVEHMAVVPAYDDYLAYDAMIGADGLPLVQVLFSPFWDFLEVLVGFEQAYFHLNDHPRAVERLLEVMTVVYRDRLWPVVAASPARLILTDAHLNSQLTPPRIFEKYLLPYHQELNSILHQNGKWAVMHADADTSRILHLIEDAGWDMVECFVTAPMVPVTLERARQAWGNRVTIWGGIPSQLLSPDIPEKIFKTYVLDLFNTIAPGDAFILGVADNVMPDSAIDRVAWISQMLEERG